MTRKTMAAVAVAAFVCAAFSYPSFTAADRPNFTGRWTLNRQLSQFPSDVGFGMDVAAGAGARGTGGGRAAWFNESQEDVKRREQLTDEVTNPSRHLTIADTDTAVAITDDRGRSRVFHPTGKEESQALDQVGVGAIARWDGDRLEVRYKVEPYRELLYTYSRTLNPPRLTVQIRFIESGGHDMVTRVYEPTRPDEPPEPAPVTPPQAVTPPYIPNLTKTPPPATPPPDLTKIPATPDRVAAPLVVAGPDGELKGLTNIGIVVEDLSSQAAACGLTQAPIEAAVSKSFSDAGLKVTRNADEDTYVYVHIITSSVSSGLCVSRYDVSLYTHTTATLSYQAKPLLVQVELLRKGGLAGGGPAAHADGVMRSVKQYADEFAKRIRDANQR